MLINCDTCQKETTDFQFLISFFSRDNLKHTFKKLQQESICYPTIPRPVPKGTS